jgi:hypothetical protein
MLNKSKLNLYSLKPFLYIGIKGKEAKEERKKNRKTINMYIMFGKNTLTTVTEKYQILLNSVN